MKVLFEGCVSIYLIKRHKNQEETYFVKMEGTPKVPISGHPLTKAIGAAAWESTKEDLAVLLGPEYFTHTLKNAKEAVKRIGDHSVRVTDCACCGHQRPRGSELELDYCLLLNNTIAHKVLPNNPATKRAPVLKKFCPQCRKEVEVCIELDHLFHCVVCGKGLRSHPT
jgi:hypothetical protein